MTELEKLDLFKDIIHEKTELSYEEINNLDLRVFVEIFDLATKTWNQVKKKVTNLYESFQEWVYILLSESTGLDAEYLKKNIDFDLAYNMLDQYSKQEEYE